MLKDLLRFVCVGVPCVLVAAIVVGIGVTFWGYSFFATAGSVVAVVLGVVALMGLFILGLAAGALVEEVLVSHMMAKISGYYVETTDNVLALFRCMTLALFLVVMLVSFLATLSLPPAIILLAWPALLASELVGRYAWRMMPAS